MRQPVVGVTVSQSICSTDVVYSPRLPREWGEGSLSNAGLRLVTTGGLPKNAVLQHVHSHMD